MHLYRINVRRLPPWNGRHQRPLPVLHRLPQRWRAQYARSKGMTDEQSAELLAVVGLANEINRLANGYDPPVDARFLEP
jgi:alkylhydroperoxidase family enzyme